MVEINGVCLRQAGPNLTRHLKLIASKWNPGLLSSRFRVTKIFDQSWEKRIWEIIERTFTNIEPSKILNRTLPEPRTINVWVLCFVAWKVHLYIILMDSVVIDILSGRFKAWSVKTYFTSTLGQCRIEVWRKQKGTKRCSWELELKVYKSWDRCTILSTC